MCHPPHHLFPTTGLEKVHNVAQAQAIIKTSLAGQAGIEEIGASYHGWASGPPSPFTRYIVQLPITAEILQIET